ncbi:Ulp1 peptidase [Ranunculus cassubicifolius]
MEVEESESQQQQHQKKQPLDLNWGVLFKDKENNGGGAPPAELVVVPKEDQKEMEFISNMSDYELEEKIKSVKKTICYCAKLPDKGEKLRRSLRLQEEELNRRKQQFNLIKETECEKSKQFQRSCSSGACNGLGSQAASPQNHVQSKFTKSFSQKLQDKPDMGTRICVNQHNKALHLDGRNHQSIKSNGGLSKRDRHESKSSLRISPARCSKASNNDVYEHRSTVGERKTIGASSFYHHNEDDDDTYSIPMRKRMESKFYYPSRDDPESVELHSSDIQCLAPEVYLSSPIMNFYIRYLQLPILDTSNSRSDYLIFNTYFYGKIKEAKACKGADGDTFFSKFRRWWKGVNIFEKAYILFPIHENFHWSLVIVCLPDKEDDSGPLVLHLDSLGYHDSTHIFVNVKSFLKKEWRYLNEKEAPPLDLPMADKVWGNLPRRIDEKRIMVPQQKNDYDCGVFVLFFMERFIAQAPNRIRRRDDRDMFGKDWFKAEEASRLRKKIRIMLQKEFKNARLTEQVHNENKQVQSPTSSGKDSGAQSINVVEDLVDVIQDSAECSVDIIEDSNS